MLRNISIKLRLILLSCVTIAFVGGIIYVLHYNVGMIRDMGVSEAGSSMLQGQRDKLQVATHTIAVSLGDVIRGVQNPNRQDQMIQLAVKNIRFEDDDSGYFFAYRGTVNVALPPKPELQGKDLGHLKDKNGVQLVAELRDLAKGGGGFVEYIWPKPNAGDQPKLSYSEMIPGTEIWIGTGVYIDNIEKETTRINASISGEANRILLWVIGGIGIVLVLLYIPFVTLLIRSIIRPVAEVAGLAEYIAAGDVSVNAQVQGRDEPAALQRAFNAMTSSLRAKVELAEYIANRDLRHDVALASDRDGLGLALQGMTHNLRELLGQVRQAAVMIAAGSNEVASSSQSLSQGATEQAASLEEITSSMTEMGSQTRHNAESATKASDIARQQQVQAGKGTKDMERMLEAMEGIGVAGNNIARIIKVIDEIAFQTNLLALNAAVEAARAGKHGKGFAVVAEEVRNLAGRSAKAAEETSTLIEDAISRVENGSSIAKETSESLNRIVDGTGSVAELVQEIATASSAQAEGIAQVRDGLSQIDTVTQTNTANAEETASAAEQLSSQSNQLEMALAKFKLVDDTSSVQVVESQSIESAVDAQIDTTSEQAALPEVSKSDTEWGKY